MQKLPILGVFPAKACGFAPLKRDKFLIVAQCTTPAWGSCVGRGELEVVAAPVLAGETALVPDPRARKPILGIGLKNEANGCDRDQAANRLSMAAFAAGNSSGSTSNSLPSR